MGWGTTTTTTTTTVVVVVVVDDTTRLVKAKATETHSRRLLDSVEEGNGDVDG